MGKLQRFLRHNQLPPQYISLSLHRHLRDTSDNGYLHFRPGPKEQEDDNRFLPSLHPHRIIPHHICNSHLLQFQINSESLGHEHGLLQDQVILEILGVLEGFGSLERPAQINGKIGDQT